MKQIAVLGLDQFGSGVARTLTRLGVEVMGVDRDPEKVAEIAPDITKAIQADLMDAEALESLALHNFDAVVLSIKDVEISCLTTIAMKDQGIRYIVARAGGNVHAKILARIGADKVIMPEQDMGIKLAHSLAGNNVIEYMELSDQYSLMEIASLDEWVGHTLKEKNIRTRYGVNVVAIRSGDSFRIAPQGDDSIRKGDILVVIGENKDIEKLTKVSNNRKNK